MTTEKILEIYRRRRSIKATAREAGCSDGVVRKALVSAGMIRSPLTERIAELLRAGMPKKDIAELLGVSKSCVAVNSPYSRKSYLDPNKTANALRVRKCREKKENTAAAAKELPE